MAASWASRPTKRLLDVAIAAPAIILLAPVTAVTAGLVRVKLGAPVAFRQTRSGRDGKPISVPKLRSMTDARDAEGNLLPDEKRLTAFGRCLRAASLDELPQLWSVIKGDMSLVGPRPLPTIYLDRYSTTQRRRLEVRPGITGWAQVNGRNATTWADRLQMDVWYVDNASFMLDVTILWRTITAVFRREGVSAEGHATMPEFTGEQ